jgi:glyoxylase-like metal-dependent hydrolase (beta-lactamase superfamily II)
MTRWKLQEHEGVALGRFSIYRFNTNMQTVYAFWVDGLLIDTGHRNSRENVKQWLEGRQVDKIAITHHHEDHTGNVAYLMKKLQVQAYAHPLCVDILGKGYNVSALGKLISGSVDKAKLLPIGDRIATPNHTFEVIHTPGHTDDHICLFERSRGWLFSGDLFVADKIKYFDTTEDLAEQIRSLRKLAALDFEALFCSHNPKTDRGRERIQSKLQHFEDFYGQVEEMHRKGMNDREILRKLGRKENYLFHYITLGNYNSVNMVKSVVRDVRRSRG